MVDSPSTMQAELLLASMITLPDNSAGRVSSLNPKRGVISQVVPPAFVSGGGQWMSNHCSGCSFPLLSRVLDTLILALPLDTWTSGLDDFCSEGADKATWERGNSQNLNLQPLLYLLPPAIHHSKLRPVNNHLPTPHGSSPL